MLGDDISSLLKTDVVLKCNSEVFKAHKAVLSARSQFFETLFRTPMEEAPDGFVTIEDVKPDIFRLVLGYIYSDQIPQMTDFKTAHGLLIAAGMYQLATLKEFCVEFLCEYLRPGVSKHTAVILLIYAHMCSLNLKGYVMRFVCDHFDVLKNSTDWEWLCTLMPTLAMDVVDAKIDSMNEELRVLKEKSVNKRKVYSKKNY